jgi:hypothetical protein
LPYWGWSDTATTDPENRYYDTDSGDNCHDTKVQHQADAQTARDAYAAQIKAQQMTQYYGGDRDKAVATVQQWKDMQSEFAQFAPPKQ